MNIRYEVIAAANGAPGNKRLFAFLCDDAPADALAKAQRSTDWLERAAIAMNPNTPPDVVQRLAKDGNSVVRSIAAHALTKTPAAVSKQPQESGSPDAPSTTSTCQTIAIELIDRIRSAGCTYSLAGTRWHKYLKASQLFGYPTEVSPYSTESREMSLLRLKFPTFDAVALLPASIQEKVWQSLASDEESAVRKAVARHPGFPAALFQSFASDSEPDVRKAILSRSDLPHSLRLKVLTEFSEKKEDWARVVLAADPICPVATMQILTKSRSFYVFEALAKNPSCPVEMVEPLLKLMSDLIKKNGHGSFFEPKRLNDIVNASTFPASVLQSLVRSKDSALRIAAAMAQNNSPASFSALGNDTDYLVRLAVAENQAAPVELRSQLFLTMSKDKDWNVRKAVAASSGCPADLLAALGKDRKGEVKDAAIASANRAVAAVQRTDSGSVVAGSPPKPMPDFEALARSARYADKLLAVEHQGCPLSILELLSSDKFNQIRIEVALLSNCPAHVLERLSSDQDAWVRRAVAYHTSCPPSVRVQLFCDLALDPSYRIRQWVAEHPLTPIETLAVLSHDSTLTVREAVRNPDCRKLNQDSFIARDPPTAPEDLMRLAQSGFYLTRLEALSNPSFPADKRSAVLTETARDIDEWLGGEKVDASSDTFEELDILQALECLNLVPNVTDKKALTNASMSKDWLERVAVLLTKGIPQSVIRLLSGDENEVVRSLAEQRLSKVWADC